MRRLFQGKSGDTGIFNGVSADGDAVIFQHGGIAVADGVANHSSALRRIDLTIEIEDRHLRREYRATIAHRQDIDTGHAEGLA